MGNQAPVGLLGPFHLSLAVMKQPDQLHIITVIFLMMNLRAREVKEHKAAVHIQQNQNFNLVFLFSKPKIFPILCYLNR